MRTTTQRGTPTRTSAALRSSITARKRAKKPSNMPRTSSDSRVHTWPSRAEVISRLTQWAERQRAKHPELVRIGYYGSLTDAVRYGFGSDADVIAVVTHSNRDRSYERSLDFDHADEVPVPVDLHVYTEDEFARILARGEKQNVVWAPAHDRTAAAIRTALMTANEAMPAASATLSRRSAAALRFCSASRRDTKATSAAARM